MWHEACCFYSFYLGFPGGSAGKGSNCSEGDLDSIPGLGRSPGEEKGYPLQYSGLENSMDCIVHGVAKSQTWLSDFHFTSGNPTVTAREECRYPLCFCPFVPFVLSSFSSFLFSSSKFLLLFKTQFNYHFFHGISQLPRHHSSLCLNSMVLTLSFC